MDQIISLPPKLTLMGVMAALRVSLFGWVGRGRLTDVLMPLVHNRVGAISVAIERLMGRFLAGKAMRRGPRVLVAAAEPVVPRVRGATFWPREFGWLVRDMKHHGALYTQQIEMLLGEPEMVALLMASPQAGRLLRPMCRMLAVDPALLRPGVVVVAREPVNRVRKKRPPVDWGRIPLPRGVLSAARRAGFKPVR